MVKIITAIIIYHLNCLLFYSTKAAVDKSGPYKSTLVRTASCPKLTLPVDKNPSMLYYAEIYNNTKNNNLMRGNMTILKDTANKRIKAKGYVWEDNGWISHYIMNNMGCHSLFLPAITAAFGIKYDKKTCTFFKGNYTFSGVDINSLQHLWLPEQEYGRIKWVVELYSQAGSVFCWEYETVVQPGV